MMATTLWAAIPGRMISGTLPSDQQELQVLDGTAVIAVIGETTKYGGFATTSTILARQRVRQAIGSSDIDSILLFFDSGGGEAAGSEDFAEDVRLAAQMKPTIAYASDMMASAAYYVASQAGRIYANTAAFIGGIGVLSTLIDESQAFTNEGIKVYPVDSGGFKHMGVAGTPITPEHIAYQQSSINQITDQFVTRIASGRAMSLETAKSLADGRLHIAADAQQIGLIDGVMALDEAISTLQSFARQLKG